MSASSSEPAEPSAKGDVPPPSIALEDALHSGHLYFVLQRARCGARPALSTLMLIYQECVRNGKEPKPAVHAFVSEAFGAIDTGRDANHALRLKKDRSGRGKTSLAGDVPRIIVDAESTARLIELMPEYRDWLIAYRLYEAGAAPTLDRKTREDMAKRFHTSPSTVGRAWKKYVSPSPDLQVLTESFAVVEETWTVFNAFVQEHQGESDAPTIAARWRKRSVQLLRELAREAAVASPDLTPAVLWSRGVVNDLEAVKVLFLCLEQFDVDGHPARITEEKAKAEFMRAVDIARGATRPEG